MSRSHHAPRTIRELAYQPHYPSQYLVGRVNLLSLAYPIPVKVPDKSHRCNACGRDMQPGETAFTAPDWNYPLQEVCFHCGVSIMLHFETITPQLATTLQPNGGTSLPWSLDNDPENDQDQDTRP